MFAKSKIISNAPKLYFSIPHSTAHMVRQFELANQRKGGLAAVTKQPLTKQTNEPQRMITEEPQQQQPSTLTRVAPPQRSLVMLSEMYPKPYIGKRTNPVPAPKEENLQFLKRMHY